ncbi:MAG: sigma 54-interacting transcriptional regulator [Planctomycetota bacterium]|nr:sigma 54-interacting transcriptional regulator [Planctomycetota bacterium]
MQQNQGSAYLILRNGGRWSDVFRLIPTQPLVIGRSSKNAIVIADDRSSRRHAEVFYENEAWKVRDLGSRNGTFVDGTSVQSVHSLQTGQVIQVAGVSMSFVESLDSVFPNEPNAAGPLSDALGENASLQQSISHTQEINLPPTIIDSKQPRAWMVNLAYKLAQQSSWEQACEVVLESLLRELKIQAGAIMRVDSDFVLSVPSKAFSSKTLLNTPASSAQSLRLAIICASERPGKAYRRVSELLAKHVLTNSQAVLARNIQNDPIFGNQSESAQASQAISTQTVLCAPIPLRDNSDHDKLSGDKLEKVKEAKPSWALLHLYARDDEPSLQSDALEIAALATQLLTIAYQQLSRQKQIEKKLQATQKQVLALKSQLYDHQTDSSMIGSSPAIIKLKSQLARVAPTHATVLLRGESGVGKELAAREIHRQSTRSDGPFIAINCGALASQLLESELFGHEKGAFTGATDRRLGKFELADGGTIFLDEVGEMSAEIQVKFLRALENQSFERVGGSKLLSVDVRVIAATNRDLEEAIREKSFRSDLYFRLRVVEIILPSLRQRPEDILPLAEHFLATFRQRSALGPTGFSEQTRAIMQGYRWPGNIRELRNAIERAHVLSVHTLAEPDDLALSSIHLSDEEKLNEEKQEAANVSPSESINSDFSYREKQLEELERDHILATLRYTEGQKSRAAAILGIERSTLDRKLKKYEE